MSFWLFSWIIIVANLHIAKSDIVLGKKEFILTHHFEIIYCIAEGHYYGLGGASDQSLIKGLVFSTKCLPERKVNVGNGLVEYIMYFFICADKILPKTSLYIMHI